MTDQTQNPYRSPEEVTEERVRGMTAEDWHAAARGLTWMRWKFVWWLVGFGVMLFATMLRPYMVVVMIPLPVGVLMLGCSVMASREVWRCMEGVSGWGRWFVWTSWAFWVPGIVLLVLLGQLGLMAVWPGTRDVTLWYIHGIAAMICLVVAEVKWQEFVALLAKEAGSRRYVWMARVLMVVGAVFFSLLVVAVPDEQDQWMEKWMKAVFVVSWGLYMLLNLRLTAGLGERIREMQDGKWRMENE